MRWHNVKHDYGWIRAEYMDCVGGEGTWRVFEREYWCYPVSFSWSNSFCIGGAQQLQDILESLSHENVSKMLKLVL